MSRLTNILVLWIAAVTVGCITAQAQSCSAPWDTAQFVYGTITFTGSGTATDANGDIQTTQQSVTVGMKLGVPALGACEWNSNFGGSYSDVATINDKVVSPCTPNPDTTTYVANGPGLNLASPGGALVINSPNFDTYNFDAGDFVNTTVTASGSCGNSVNTFPTLWGSAIPFGDLVGPVPLLASTAVVSGTATVSGTPADTLLAPATWNGTWTFAAVPDDTCIIPQTENAKRHHTQVRVLAFSQAFDPPS